MKKKKVMNSNDRSVELENSPGNGGDILVRQHAEVEVLAEDENYTKVRVTDNKGKTCEGYISNEHLVDID